MEELGQWALGLDRKRQSLLPSFLHLLPQPPVTVLLPCSLSGPFVLCLCSGLVHISPHLLSHSLLLGSLFSSYCPSAQVHAALCVNRLVQCDSHSDNCSEVLSQYTKEGVQVLHAVSKSFCQLPAIAGGSHGPLSAHLDLLFSKAGKGLELLLLPPTL